MNVEDMLNTLRQTWNVTLTADAEGFELTLVAGPDAWPDEPVRDRHVYLGGTLSRVVTRAYAGERGDA